MNRFIKKFCGILSSTEIARATSVVTRFLTIAVFIIIISFFLYYYFFGSVQVVRFDSYMGITVSNSTFKDAALLYIDINDSEDNSYGTSLNYIIQGRTTGGFDAPPGTSRLGTITWYSKDDFRGTSREQENLNIWLDSDEKSRAQCLLRQWTDKENPPLTVRFYEKQHKKLPTFEGTANLHYTINRKTKNISFPVMGILYKYEDCTCRPGATKNSVVCKQNK